MGRGAAYRAARLRSDHPDIADRMAAGEFRSVAHAERVARGEPEPVRPKPLYARWDDPVAADDPIPAATTLYRGIYDGRRDDGLSWTDDPAVAHQFVWEYSQRRTGTSPRVLERPFDLSEVLF
jgi:hypothetical protein